MSCFTALHLRMKWLVKGEQGCKDMYIEHRKHCKTCRSEMDDCNRLARQPYTAQQEAAWEAEGC